MVDLRMNEQEQPVAMEPNEELMGQPHLEAEVMQTNGESDIAAALESMTTPNEPATHPFHPAPLYQKLLPLMLAALILASDQLSKRYIIATLDVHESRAPIPALDQLFQFTHIHNTGAAFGMFPAGGFIFTIIAIVVAVAIVVYTRRLDAGHYLLRIALGLQLGGALGNLIDRLRQGYVTDFLDFIPFPFIFNIADLSIVSGVVVLFYLMLLETLEERRQKQAQEVLAGKREENHDAAATDTTTHTLSNPHSFADSESL